MSLKSLIDSAAEHGALLSAAIYAVAGLTGGCYVAAYAYIRGRKVAPYLKVTPYLVLAYCTIGMIMSVTCGLALKILLNTELSWERSFLVGTITAVMGVISVAGFSLRASMKIPYTDSQADISIGKDDK